MTFTEELGVDSLVSAPCSILEARQPKGSTTMLKRRGLWASVYRSPAGDCTNGGLTSQVNRVFVTSTLPLPANTNMHVWDGVAPLLAVEPDYLGVPKAIPTIPVADGHVGWMAGGNFVYSSDSRWSDLTGSRQPVAVHDRQESYLPACPDCLAARCR